MFLLTNMNQFLCVFFFRVAEFSLKFQPAQNCHRLCQRHKPPPRVIRVTAYRNGSRAVCAKVTAPTITLVTGVQVFSAYSLYNIKNEKDDIYCVNMFFLVV